MSIFVRISLQYAQSTATPRLLNLPKSKDAENKLMQNGVPVKLPESHTCFNQLVLPGEILELVFCYQNCFHLL